MAYNEEANIGNALEAILNQTLSTCPISELVVVASGCTDRTVEIVEAKAEEDGRVRLIVQAKRLGKASAINEFVRAARGSVLLMVGADVLVKDGSVEAMLRHFNDPDVGMVGGHPIPVNDEATFLGHAAHLLWRLHDRLARVAPKLGEIVAFRNVIPSIPLDTAVDEISIQVVITQMGYRLVYEPEAIVYNHGPTTLGDFVRQRRRIHAGHLRVRRQQAYEASTMSVLRIGRCLVGSGSFSSPRAALWTGCAIGLEAVARGLGHYDHLRRRSHHIWETAVTTKQHVGVAASGSVQQTVVVFNILDFNRLRLELGLRMCRRLLETAMQRIQHGVGPKAVVSVHGEGPIVVLMSANRGEAQLIAAQVVEELNLKPIPVGGRLPGLSVRIACAIVEFSPSGEALAESILPTGQHAVRPAIAS